MIVNLKIISNFKYLILLNFLFTVFITVAGDTSNLQYSSIISNTRVYSLFIYIFIGIYLINFESLNKINLITKSNKITFSSIFKFKILSYVIYCILYFLIVSLSITIFLKIEYEFYVFLISLIETFLTSLFIMTILIYLKLKQRSLVECCVVMLCIFNVLPILCNFLIMSVKPNNLIQSYLIDYSFIYKFNPSYSSYESLGFNYLFIVVCLFLILNYLFKYMKLIEKSDLKGVK